MEIEIEKLDNPIKVFAEFINLVEDYIMNVVCQFEPDAKLSCTKEDFPILEEVIVAAYDESAPEAVKESMIRGAMFAFSEILTKDFGLQWCVVRGGAFPGYGMRIENSSSVIYLREMIDKYIEESEEINFEEIYLRVKSLVSEIS